MEQSAMYTASQQLVTQHVLKGSQKPIFPDNNEHFLALV